MNRSVDVLAVTLALVIGTAARAQTPKVNPVCERLLPAAVVGRVAGEPKAALIPLDPSVGAGGTCNYAADPSAPKKAVILLANLNENAGHADFAVAAAQGGQQPIAGLGDEAVASATIVTARKGRLLVVLSSFTKVDLNTWATKPCFTKAQLLDLVRQALAKA